MSTDREPEIRQRLRKKYVRSPQDATRPIRGDYAELEPDMRVLLADPAAHRGA